MFPPHGEVLDVRCRIVSSGSDAMVRAVMTVWHGRGLFWEAATIDRCDIAQHPDVSSDAIGSIMCSDNQIIPYPYRRRHCAYRSSGAVDPDPSLPHPVAWVKSPRTRHHPEHDPSVRHRIRHRIWGYVRSMVRASDRTVRMQAAKVCAMLLIRWCGDDLPALSAPEIRAVWEWIADDLHARMTMVQPLVAMADPYERTWIGHFLQTWGTLRHRLDLCLYISPIVVPHLRIVMHDGLRSDVPEIRWAAVTALCTWVYDPDPQLAAWAATRLWNLLADHYEDRGRSRGWWNRLFPNTDSSYLPLHVRISIIAALVRYARIPVPSETMVLSDLAAAIRSADIDSSCAHMALTIIGMVPSWWFHDGLVNALVVVMHRCEQIGERIMAFLARAVRQSGDYQRVVWWVHVLWNLLTSDSAFPFVQIMIARQINEGYSWGPAATMLQSRMFDLAMHLSTLDFHAVHILIHGPWRYHLVTTILYHLDHVSRMAHPWILRDMLSAAWNLGHDRYLLHLLTEHPDLFPDPDDRLTVLRHGLSSRVGETVWAIMEQDYPDQARTILVSELANASDGDDTIPYPMSLLRIVEQTVLDTPDLVTPSVMRWIWTTHAATAVSIVHRLMAASPSSMTLDDIVRLVYSLGEGWGRGYDRDIGMMVQWLLSHGVIGSHDQDAVVHAIGTVIGDGIGRGDPDVLISLIHQIIHVVPSSALVPLAHTARCAWNRGEDAIARWLMHALVSLSHPDLVRAVIAVVREQWGNGYDHWIRAFLHTILRSTIRSHAPANDASSAMVLCQALLALGDGWGYDGDNDMIDIIDEVMSHAILSVSPTAPFVGTIVATVTTVAIDGIPFIGEDPMLRILSTMTSFSPYWVLEGIARWMYRSPPSHLDRFSPSSPPVDPMVDGNRIAGGSYRSS